MLLLIVAPVKGFGSASFMDIVTCVFGTSYLGLWDGPGASPAMLQVLLVSHAALGQYLASALCLGAIFAI